MVCIYVYIYMCVRISAHTGYAHAMCTLYGYIASVECRRARNRLWKVKHE